MASTAVRPPLITIIGATGTGKSNLAVDLALALNGEIINGDAMQMYEGLPIITNKITKEEMCRVPHHLLGFLDVRDVWRVGKFVREAERIIEEIRSRGRLPILVGGSHYYLQSLLFPHSISPPNECNKREDDKNTTEDIEDETYLVPSASYEILKLKYPILNAPTPELYSALRAVDPSIAAKWHPNDRRKILRSLQIYYASNCTTTASQIYAAQLAQKQNTAWTRYRNLIFWVHAETDVLKARLDGRVDKMIESGMWEEVEEMKRIYDAAVGQNKESEKGEVDLGSGIWQSIGFKELLPFLKLRDQGAGEKELEDMRLSGLSSMKTSTRQYARRQIRWIRIKFLTTLEAGKREAGADADSKSRNENGDIFLLDSTNPSTFSETVSRTAIDITKKFTSNRPLPDPLLLSPLATASLTPKRAYDSAHRPDLWVQFTCELCRVTCTNAEEWQIHEKSQRHKKSVIREKNRPEVEAHIRKRKEEEARKKLMKEDGDEKVEFRDRSR